MSVSGLGALASPLANFIAIPIVARLYGPEAYGIWATLLSIAIIAGTVSTLRYELAIVIADDENEAGHVTVLSLVSVLAISFVVLLLIVPVYSLFDSVVNITLLLLVPLIVLFSGMKLVLDAVTTRAGLFVLRSSSLAALAIGTGGSQILFHYIGKGGTFGLLVGSVVGFATSVTILLLGNIFLNKHFLSNWSFREIFSVAAKHIRFPKFSVPYTLTGNLRREGTKLIVAAFGIPALVGAFALSQRVTNFPAMAFSNGIRPVLFRKAASGEDIRPFLNRLVLLLMMLVMPAAGVVAINADKVMLFIFGDKWADTATMVQWMVIPAAFLVCIDWMDRLLDVYGKQKQMFIIEVCGTMISVGGLLYGLFVLSSPETGVALFSVGLLTQYLILGYVALSSSGITKRAIFKLIFSGIIVLGATLILSVIIKSSHVIISLVAPLILGYLAATLVLYLSQKGSK